MLCLDEVHVGIRLRGNKSNGNWELNLGFGITVKLIVHVNGLMGF